MSTHCGLWSCDEGSLKFDFGALGATTEASRSTVKDAELQELRRVFFDMFLLFVQLLRAAMLLLLSRPDFQSFFFFCFCFLCTCGRLTTLG